MIEIFAIIIAVLILVKIAVILIKPSAWFNMAKRVWAVPVITGLVCFVLAGVVLYYLLQSMTIVQIFGAMLFFSLIAGLTMAGYSKEFMELGSKLLKKNLVKKAIIPILIWLALCIWVLKELLM